MNLIVLEFLSVGILRNSHVIGYAGKLCINVTLRHV